MQIGLCTRELDTGAYAEAGIDYVERATAFAFGPANVPAKAWVETLKAVTDSALPTPVCNLFFPPKMKVVGPDRDLSQTLDYVGVVLDRLRDVGAEIQVFGSGGARGVPEGYDAERALDELKELCAAIGPVAEASGVVIAMEHLRAAECNMLTTLAETAEFVREVNHPAVRLLVDGYHVAQMSEPYDVLRSCGDLLVHVHVADPETRGAPAECQSDLRPLFRELKAIGYDGRISMECRWDDLAASLGPSRELIVAQWAEC
jgi:sugar phosphate isomerase/epimerase